MKSEEQIEAAEKDLYLRRWYDVSKAIAPAPLAGLADPASEARRQVEEEYGPENLGPYSDFEWGVLQGKHVALRWVLVDDAAWDDEWLADT